MRINIDIQIENDNGKPLHRFQKQFDCEETGIVPYENQSFDAFLAQILSYSGRTVRSVLLAEESFSGRQPESELQIKEVEYTVRLNSGNTFGGVIPFYPMAGLEENIGGHCLTEEASLPYQDSVRSNVVNGNPFQKRRFQIRSAVELIMEHAVVQYEAQFLQISGQEVHFMKHS